MAAAQLSYRPVFSAMTPLADISMIAHNASLGDALLHAHMDMHTRFPVFILEGDIKIIKGYINFKDIVAALKLNPENPSIEGIIRPIKFIDEKTSLSVALEIMIHEKSHITIVINEQQQPVGMITMEDIIEEMTGDIEDEFDRLPSYIHPYAGGWVVGGGVMMKQLIETMGLKEERPDLALSNQRLSDWCSQKVSSLKGGETIEDGHIRVMVRKLRRKYAGELVVYNTSIKA
jgi:putative hemolysin